jgi:ABC-type transporter Mla subunit MlaD
MRAAESAKLTATLIETTTSRVKEGSSLVSKTTDAFAELNRNAEKVSGLVAEIAAASREQARGIDQVGSAITEMDKVVQQTAANAEESASASEELNAQAGQMQAVAETLMRIVVGSETVAAGAKKPVAASTDLSAKISGAVGPGKLRRPGRSSRRSATAASRILACTSDVADEGHPRGMPFPFLRRSYRTFSTAVRAPR